uniref:Uncharacterized protein n=1 Tax=Rhizophora mucronata TaxID=61149 RepID=A0A2P2IKV1_RHIMU
MKNSKISTGISLMAIGASSNSNSQPAARCGRTDDGGIRREISGQRFHGIQTS